VDVWRITLAALRRWYILIPLLALTAWGAMFVGDGFQPQYEVHATAMMTPGRTEPEVPNPYGDLDDANQAVTIVLNSAEARQQIIAQGLSADYEVTADSRSTILQMVVRSDDRDAAVDTGTALLGLASKDLTTRQTEVGLAKSSQYTLSILAAPSVINVVYDGKLRTQAIVGLLGASVALVIAVLFDDIIGLVRRRRTRRKEPKAPVGDSADEPSGLSADDSGSFETAAKPGEAGTYASRGD